MKKFKKIMALTIAFVMILTSTVFAAVPNNSIVVGGKAVSTDYLFNDVNGGQTLINELLDANQDEPVFVQLDGQYDEFTNVFTGQTATDSELDKVTKYINADGVEEDLDNNDGDLEVVEVSAINAKGEAVDLQDATVGPNDDIQIIFSEEVSKETVNRNSVKLYQGSVLVVINDIKADKDGKTFTISHATLEDDKDYKLVISDEVATAEGDKVTAKEVTFKSSSDFVLKSVQVGAVLNVKNKTDIAKAQLVQNNDITLTLNHSIDPTSIRQDNISFERVVKAGVALTTPEKINVTGTVVGSAVDTSKQLNINIDDSVVFSANDDVVVLKVEGLKDINGKELEAVTYELSVDQSNLTSSAVGPNGTALANNNYYYGLTSLQKEDGTILPGFKIVVNFTVPVDPYTVDSKSVKLQKLNTDGTYTDVAANLTLNSKNTAVTVVPTTDLERNAEYRLVTTTDIKSAYDKKATNSITQAFKTTDSVGPAVLTTSPETGVTDVKVGEKFELVVNFDKEVRFGTIAAGAAALGAPTFATGATGVAANAQVAVYDASTGAYITPAFAYVDGTNNKSVKLTFAANTLTKNHTYVVKFTGAEGSQDSAKRVVEDAFGNVMEKDYQIQFTTEGVDSTAPTVSKVTVGNVAEGTALTTGATNLDVNKAINFEYSEKLATKGTFTVEKYQPSTGTWVADAGLAVTLNALPKATYRDSYDYVTAPAGIFTTDTKYRLTIKDQVDTSTNQQSNEYKMELAFGKGPEVITTVNTATTVDTGGAAVGNTVNVTADGANAAGIVSNDLVAFKLDNGKYHVSKVTVATDTLTLATPLTTALSAGNAVVKVPTVGAFQTGVNASDAIVAVLKAGTDSADARVNLDSISSTSVYLEDAEGNKVAATVSASQADYVNGGDVADAIVEILPTSKLAANTTYKVVFDGVKDVVGNTREKTSYSFKTAAATVVPTVTFSNITDNDLFTLRNLDTAIELTFNGKLSTAAGATGANQSDNYVLFEDTNANGIKDAGETTTIAVKPVVDEKTNKVVLYPDTALVADKVYGLEVANTITVGGVALSTNVDADRVLTFKTIKNPATPNAASTLGINKATYNATTKVLKLTFDRPVTAAGADTNYTLTGGTLKIVGTPAVSADGLTVSMVLDTTSTTPGAIIPGTSTIATDGINVKYTDSTGAAIAFSATAVTVEAE